MFGLKLSRKDTEVINAAAPAIKQPEPAAIASAPAEVIAPSAQLPKSRIEEMAEYATVAAQIGLAVPALEIERFVAILERLNYPVYSLEEVRAYMDDKEKREGSGYGWEWKAIREKDRMSEISFGRASGYSGFSGRTEKSSDYYSNTWSWGGAAMLRELYTRIVPLHALKRIAAIEKEYDKPVHFVVSDYTPQPHLRADPFLMAVIPNPHLNDGIGRFVIDFWDEPGFGIEQMLK